MKKELFLQGFYASGSCPMAIALKQGLDGVADADTRLTSASTLGVRFYSVNDRYSVMSPK